MIGLKRLGLADCSFYCDVDQAQEKPYINAQGWEYLVLLDPNGDLKRAMNVNNVPHTFLVDGNGKIVWDHNNYSPGDEEELYKELIKIAK